MILLQFPAESVWFDGTALTGSALEAAEILLYNNVGCTPFYVDITLTGSKSTLTERIYLMCDV